MPRLDAGGLIRPARRSFGRRLTCGATPPGAAALSLVVAATLWVAARGLRSLGGSGALSSASRPTGLFPADLLLLKVLLMARVPLAERAFGRNQPARRHRWAGSTPFLLPINLGYAAARAGTVAELWVSGSARGSTMRRIALWLLSTIAALVVLFSYRTSTMGAGGAGSPRATGTEPSIAPDGSVTYQGSTARTRWGPVRVAITVANGKITEVSVPVYPTGNGRDQEINAYALPILQQETLAAQSADIDTVSGATVTSNGYKHSLQAALDAAHIK